MDGKLTDYGGIAERIAAVPGVVSAIPLVEGQALASGPNNSSGALIRGIREADLPRVPAIFQNVRIGTLQGFDTAHGVAIGTRLASDLGVTVGENVTIVTPRGSVTPLGVTPRVKAYPVVAIFEIGMSEYDSTVRHHAVRRRAGLFQPGRTRRARSRSISPTPTRSTRCGRLIERAADRQVFLSDWQQRNVTFFSALEVERNVMFLILTLIVLVAALNIISGLTMLVKDKGHDIAILRTMGATRGAILRVFFITGASIGTIGTLAGFILGVVVCLNVESIRQFIAYVTQTEHLLAGALLPEPAARRNGPARDDLGHRHGAGALVSRHALPGVAGGAPRSGRGAALRMSTPPQRQSPAAGPPAQGHRADATPTPPGGLTVLSGANLAVFPGEMVAMVAPSGAGKSTLLHIAGLLEHPDARRGVRLRPRRPASSAIASARRSAASTSASSISSTTCCRSSRRWKTS